MKVAPPGLKLTLRNEIGRRTRRRAAAALAACVIVFSEDLNHGQDYGGVQVENPFRGL